MNNEIKEILDYLKNNSYTYDEVYIEDYCKIIAKEENKKLLDYITNLQEENKELNDDSIWWNNRFKAVERDNREYKARIDKAIEHLKEVMKDEEEYEEDYIYNKYLLDILQGSDKE